jgi:hypothetical protein
VQPGVLGYCSSVCRKISWLFCGTTFGSAIGPLEAQTQLALAAVEEAEQVSLDKGRLHSKTVTIPAQHGGF